MKKNLFLVAVTCSVLLPVTACGTQHFKKSNVEQTQAQPVTSVTEAKGAVTEKSAQKIFDGEWVITSVGDTKINREEDYPYINFDAEENKFYGSNGCNVLNGQFTYDIKNKTISFLNVIATMRYCADTPWDTKINAALGEGTPIRFEYEVVDGEPLLYLLGKGGARALTMHKSGLDFMNGNWVVRAIKDEKFTDGDMTIFFDMEERKVHGNTGCNSFNGEIYVDPQDKRVFSLSNIAVTLSMCPNMERQSKFLVALEQTNGAKLGKNGTIYLTNADGKAIVELQKK